MLITSLLLLSPLQAPVEAPKLVVGDRAPAIQVAEWVQGKPVTAFEPGQTYVVEFWATWCGPCKVVIPHMNELSKQYAGKVQFIGVSVWENIDAEEPYWVPKFVQEMGDKMTYTVAADRVKPREGEDDGPMAANWMKAAGQNGIPTAFIVDGSGRIAWIGHPAGIDKPLADVVAGKWDLAAASTKYALDLRLKETVATVRREVTKAKKEKDLAAAIRAIEAAVAQDAAIEAYFGLDKYFLLAEARPSEAASYGQRLVAEVFAQNGNALNQLAWTIVEPGKKVAGDYALAVAAAERAAELTHNQDASTLDTLGLALFRLGKVERAIEVQARAVELAEGQGDLEKDLRARLEQFRSGNKSL